jgi:hypothetical protein
VTVTATGCPAGDAVRWAVLGDRKDPINDGFGRTPDGPKVTGPTWTAYFKFPESQLGSAQVEGACEDNSGYSVGYPPVAVYVSTDRRLLVNPSTTLTQGATVTVRSSGPGCDWLSEVELALRGPTYVYPEPKYTGDQRTQWQATFALSPALRPGTYVLYADCVYSRASTATYEPLTIIVQAAHN